MLEWKVQIPIISLCSLNAQCAKDSDTLQQIPWLLGISEDGLFIRLEFLRRCLYSLKNRLGRTCYVKFSLCSTPQASRKVYFLTYPSFLLCYFNENWFCPSHAAPEEQLQLHTGFCTGWASWKTGLNREHLLRLLLSQLCYCCVQGWKRLGLFPFIDEGDHTSIILFGFFFCKARKLKSHKSCREESGALTQVWVLPAAWPFAEDISVCTGQT